MIRSLGNLNWFIISVWLQVSTFLSLRSLASFPKISVSSISIILRFGADNQNLFSAGSSTLGRSDLGSPWPAKLGSSQAHKTGEDNQLQNIPQTKKHNQFHTLNQIHFSILSNSTVWINHYHQKHILFFYHFLKTRFKPNTPTKQNFRINKIQLTVFMISIFFCILLPKTQAVEIYFFLLLPKVKLFQWWWALLGPPFLFIWISQSPPIGISRFIPFGSPILLILVESSFFWVLPY